MVKEHVFCLCIWQKTNLGLRFFNISEQLLNLLKLITKKGNVFCKVQISDFFGFNFLSLSRLNFQSKTLLATLNGLSQCIVQNYCEQLRGYCVSLQQTCGDFEEFSFTVVKGHQRCFLVSFTNCVHQLCGDAIALENLKHLSPVDRVKGFSEVDECNHCWQISVFKYLNP